jgi:hypothetical protein
MFQDFRAALPGVTGWNLRLTARADAIKRAAQKTRKFMSNTYVPLISSGTAGPLGVLHLPRLWLKASLEARGKLAAGYPGCGKGYDQMVLDGLGLDRQKTLDYIKNSRPSYNSPA